MDKHLPGTKIAEQLLSRSGGASMDEIIAATGGPQYNVLRRLKAKGYTIRTAKEGRATRYHAVAPGRPSHELTVSARGQVVLPKDMRERLGIAAGGKVRAEIDGDKVVIARKTTSIADLAGLLHRPGMRARSLEEIEAGIAAGAVESAMRGLKRRK